MKYEFLETVVEVDERSMVLRWTCKGVGFGEISFYVGTSGVIERVDTEMMGPEFVGQALDHWQRGLKRCG